MTRRPSRLYLVLALLLPMALVGQGGSGHPSAHRPPPPVPGVDLATPLAPGSLFPGPVFQAGTRPIEALAADFNADGHPDLVALDAPPGLNGELSVLLGVGDGTFQDRASIPLGRDAFALVSADFNDRKRR